MALSNDLSLLYRFADKQNLSGSHGLGPRLTITRAADATRYDENGILRTAPGTTGDDDGQDQRNAPRFDHEPETGAPLGLLVEDESSNLIPNSNDFLAGTWNNNLDAINPGQSGVDGANSATELVDTDPSSSSQLNTASRVAATDNLCYSAYVKLSGNQAHTTGVMGWSFEGTGAVGTWSVTFRFSDQAFNVISIGLLDSVTTSVDVLPDGWFRIEIRMAKAATNINPIVRVRPATLFTDIFDNSPTGSIFFTKAQGEQSPIATSYIDNTTGGALVRPADVVSTSDVSWYNQGGAGTIVSEFTFPVIPSGLAAYDDYYVQIDAGTTSNRVASAGRQENKRTRHRVQQGGSLWASIDVAQNVYTGAKKWTAFGYATNDAQAYADGISGSPAVAGIPPSGLTTLNIGTNHNGSSPLKRGHLSEVRCYNTRRPDTGPGSLDELSQGNVPETLGINTMQVLNIQSASDSASLLYTPPAGTDTALVIVAGTESTANTPITGITVDGQAAVLALSHRNPDDGTGVFNQSVMYWFPNPGTSEVTIAVNGGNTGRLTLWAATVTNMDQSSPVIVTDTINESDQEIITGPEYRYTAQVTLPSDEKFTAITAMSSSEPGQTYKIVYDGTDGGVVNGTSTDTAHAYQVDEYASGQVFREAFQASPNNPIRIAGLLVLFRQATPPAPGEYSSDLKLLYQFAQTETLAPPAPGLGPALDFTRASEATRYDENGLLDTVGSFNPRFDHDPTKTGPVTGGEIAGGRTDFSQSPWVGNDNGALPQDSGQLGPDGVNNAWSLIDTDPSGFHSQGSDPLVVVSGIKHTLSWYYKADGVAKTTRFPGVRVTLSGGSATFSWATDETQEFAIAQSGITDATGKITVVERQDGAPLWLRAEMTFTTIATNPQITIFPAIGAGSDLLVNNDAALATRDSTDLLMDYLQLVAGEASQGSANPAVETALGLLVEDERTNSIRRSEDLTDSEWIKTRTTIDPTPVTAPDGQSATTTLVLETTASGFHNLNSYAPFLTDSADVSISGYFKAYPGTSWSVVSFRLQIGGNAFGVAVDLDARTLGASLSAGSFTYGASSIELLPDGWMRVSVTGNVGASPGQAGIQIYLNDGASYAGSVTDGFYFWGAQVEDDSPISTSYIRTTGTAVVRPADVVSTNDVSWLQDGPATWHIANRMSGPYITTDTAFTLIRGTATSDRLVHFTGAPSDGGAGSRFLLNISSQTSRYNETVLGDYYNGELQQSAFGYELSDYLHYWNGQPGTRSTSGNPSFNYNVDTLIFGVHPGLGLRPIAFHVEEFRCYNTRRPDDEAYTVAGTGGLLQLSQGLVPEPGEAPVVPPSAILGSYWF